jgi:hypothetical protein
MPDIRNVAIPKSSHFPIRPVSSQLHFALPGKFEYIGVR